MLYPPGRVKRIHQHTAHEPALLHSLGWAHGFPSGAVQGGALPLRFIHDYATAHRGNRSFAAVSGFHRQCSCHARVGGDAGRIMEGRVD